MEISEDKTLAQLQIAGAMNAQELDELISLLGELRSNMLPPVSAQRPNPLTQGDTPATVEDAPAMMAASLKDGRTRIWARSAGFGWMAFNLRPIDAITLRDWLAANVQGDSDLFGDSITHTH